MADDPKTHTTETTYFCLYTEEVEDIPLPPSSVSTRELSKRHHLLVFHRYQQLTEAIKKRVRDAKEQIARNKSKIIVKTTISIIFVFSYVTNYSFFSLSL